MTRPSVLHQGFFVPNAQDVTKPELAEPDRIDFNTVAHTRWGVLNGCLVTATGSTATNTAGTALVNGVLVSVTGGQNVSVGAGGAQDRFDIVGVDSTGALVAIHGSESLDPVFPDVPLNVTTLASVLCTAGGGSYTDNVIDKRKILADSLLTKIPAANELLANRNGAGNLFRVDGAGTTSWNDDTIIRRHDVGTLRISTHLRIDDTLVVGGITTTRALVATERVTGSNLRNGSTTPADGDGHSGDLFQHNGDGTLWLHQGGKWEQMATVKAAMPVGSIITSLQRPASMPPGWVPLDGSAQVFQSTQPELFALLDSWGWPKSGINPNQVITTRNANKRVLMVDSDAAGSLGGSSTATIGITHLPAHAHNVKTSYGGGFTPWITVARSGGHRHSVVAGEHTHNVVDYGHGHYWGNAGSGGGFVVASWGGQNKLDAYFNDRSHTWSVDVADWTHASGANIEIGASGSWHGHEVSDSGDHDHQVNAAAVPAHVHNVLEDPIGNGTPLPVTPAYLAVYCYIRS